MGRNSFSNEVRRELCRLNAGPRHCLLAELSALNSQPAENEIVRRRFNVLLREAFGPETVSDETVNRLHKALADPYLTAHSCCKRAYARGAFILCGTINDPSKSYHLEYTFAEAEAAGRLHGVFGHFGLSPKRLRRKTYNILYFKESESIADALRIMEAPVSILSFENSRVVKEMRNDVNRKVNFETANLNKTVGAAVNQIKDIRYIADAVGLGQLSKPLEEVARLRLAYETASLHEIGAMLDPPVTKSGVNHRLRKIGLIAESLKDNKII